MPWPVRSLSASPQEPESGDTEETEEEAETATGPKTIDSIDDVVELATTSAPAAAVSKGPKDVETLSTLEELVEYFIAAGRRGVAVNRYKGLGEMNPETLWETTMDPSKRTLLEVRAEDHTEADLMFTTLMGDQVEPRRKFIEEHALDVKNLDI